jgi:ABC-type oligopeptide transport system substrate-binding subunit
MWKVFWLLILSGLVACGNTQNFSDELTLGRVGDIDGFNPFFSQQPWFQGVYATGEGLYRFDVNRKKLVLFHAKSINQKKNTFVVTLQPLKWSDGSSLEVKDYVVGCRWLTDPKLNAPNGTKLRAAGVKCHADGTRLIVTMRQARTANLLDLRPVPHQQFGSLTLEQLKSIWMTLETVVTTGAFLPISWQKNKQVVFIANPHYLAADETGRLLPRTKRVVVDVYPDHKTLVKAFNKGQVDLMAGIRVSDIFNNPYARVVRSENSFQITQLTYNFDRVASVKQDEVRRALAASTGDFEVKTPVFPGGTQVLLADHKTNPQALKKLQGRYRLAYPESDQRLKTLAQQLSQQLIRFGVRLDLKPISLDALKKRDFEFLIYDVVAYGLEPFGEELRCGKMQWLIHAGGCRYGWEKNLMRLLEQSPQPVQKIASALHQHLPSIPLVSQHYVAAWQPWLKGLLPSEQQNGMVGSADLVFLERLEPELK